VLDIRTAGAFHYYLNQRVSLDAIDPSDTALGYGTLFRALTYGSFTPNHTTTQTFAVITQFHYVPTPSALPLLGIAGMFVTRRRTIVTVSRHRRGRATGRRPCAGGG
jgi:hypothetical protein